MKHILSLTKYIILIFSSFLAMLPLYSCFVISLKSPGEMTYNTIMNIPNNPLNLENYKYVFENSNLLKAFMLSFVILLITLFISTICSAMVSYVIYRLNLKQGKIIMMIYLIVSLIPPNALQTPIFLLLASMNLINTLFGYIISMCGADVISMLVFGRYYHEISKSIDKAALIDGCNCFSLFFRIHLPILKPAFLTAAIIKGVYVYNEYYIANIFLLDKQTYPTVTTELYSFLGPFGNNYTVICAACIIAVLPVLILFVAAQKKIYSGFAG